MKRVLSIIFIMLSVQIVLAVPAKLGIWKTITLADGTEVKVQLSGDEHSHFWRTSDGVKYIYNTDNAAYKKVDSSTLLAAAKAKIAKRVAVNAAKSKSNASSSSTAFTGKKKGLIILVQFTDKSFSSGHTKSLYNRIANETGFTSTDGFKGSVCDYFKAQSAGQFELDFDVIGPVTMSNTYSYYGGNDRSGNDKYPGKMVAEACTAIKDSVNFSDYDWDGDGNVDQVFVLYAGQGEADSGIENTIWPHEWQLSSSDYGGSLTLDNVTIDTYACSNELTSNSTIEGIGTICHEFSHCLGLPDLYDTGYSGYYGMGSWDLMCDGSYNGDTFVPAGYTSYEKMVCGWLTPTELKDVDSHITNMKALSDGGGAYIIYNANHANEYYLIENRQKINWDAQLPGSGVLILHVDYDQTVWDNNVVNTVESDNDHQRLTIFHADNDDDKSYWSSRDYSYSKTTEYGDPYPYNGNDSLTNNSTPAATLYNANTDGTKYMNRAIYLTQNSDGTVNLDYKAISKTISNVTTVKGDTLFYESFNKCAGTGGNDGSWSGPIASSTFNPDNQGWSITSANDVRYGAYQCARFGSSSQSAGYVTSPSFNLTGDAILSLKMAPWGTETNAVDVRLNGTSLENPTTLTTGTWTQKSFSISGNGTMSLTFVSSKNRFFLDEVLVKKLVTMGINNVSEVKQTINDGRIYSISGQYMGTDWNALGKGIYIMNGKKIVK